MIISLAFNILKAKGVDKSASVEAKAQEISRDKLEAVYQRVRGTLDTEQVKQIILAVRRKKHDTTGYRTSSESLDVECNSAGTQVREQPRVAHSLRAIVFRRWHWVSAHF